MASPRDARRRRPQRSAAAPRAPIRRAGEATASAGAVRIVIAAALAVGLAMRIALVILAPRYGYFGDHDDYVRWGIQAVDQGVTTLYERPPPRQPAVVVDADGHTSLHVREYDRILNYPPLAAYVLWLEGAVHRGLDDHRYVNTVRARALFSAAAIVGDVLLAWGCLIVVGGVEGSIAGAVAFALVFLAPPLALDGAFWGQTESWLLAPTIWMVHAMQQGRWRGAGVLWGLALGLKTQAVLFAPLWLIALLIVRPRSLVLQGWAIAALVVNVAALPFWLTSGGKWFYYAFTDNLLNQYAETTLFAFNVWYVDLLVTGTRDAAAHLAGLSRDLWGRLLVAAGLVTGCWLFVRHWREEPLRWAFLAGWSVLVAVMLPTRVHERYLVLCLPFLMCAAFRARSAAYGVAGLAIAATFQITVNNWQTFLASNTLQDFIAFYHQYVQSLAPEQRRELPPLAQHISDFWARRSTDLPKEWALVALSLLSTVWVLVALSRYRPSVAKSAP